MSPSDPDPEPVPVSIFSFQRIIPGGHRPPPASAAPTIPPPAVTGAPWAALTQYPTPEGAIPIEDDIGHIIGWSGDLPRDPDTTEPLTIYEIKRNARMMAAAPNALEILVQLAEIEPPITARMKMRGIDPDWRLSGLAQEARALIDSVLGRGARS